MDINTVKAIAYDAISDVVSDDYNYQTTVGVIVLMTSRVLLQMAKERCEKVCEAPGKVEYKKPEIIEKPTAEKILDEVEKEQKRKKGKPKDIGKVAAMINTDCTQKKIADEFGVSPATVCQWAKEAKEKGLIDD